MLKVQNLSFSYDHALVLNDIHFEIEQGSIVGILGLSGSGKTTLLKILSGLLIPKQGQVTIDNEPTFIDDKPSKALTQDLGVVFQQFNLFMHLTVVDNLALPLRLRTKLSKASCRQKAIELLDSFGLKDQADKFPNQCSGGQQQRIAICRALINDPEIILADEPTGALDSKSGLELMKIFKSFKEQGKTLVMVTHTTEVAKFADRIIYMKDGVVVDNDYKLKTSF
jgi:ABC-type lipoprotein export system ATPase subunit